MKTQKTGNPKIAWNRLYTYVLRAAKTRDIDFNIPFDFLIKIVKMDCVYCGRPPQSELGNKIGHSRAKFVPEEDRKINGIDRIDPRYGYVKWNVVPCCWECNDLKSDYVLGDLICQISSMLPNLIKLHIELSAQRKAKSIMPSLVKRFELIEKTMRSFFAKLLS